MDFKQAISELARVTEPGGIHTHQIDLRDHRNFDRPLDHLLIDRDAYIRFRAETHGSHGTSMRMPEMLNALATDFWIWEVETGTLASIDYTSEIVRKLPSGSVYGNWPPQLLALVGGRVWLVKKDRQNKAKLFGRYLPRFM